jgi:hypothetical protein
LRRLRYNRDTQRRLIYTPFRCWILHHLTEQTYHNSGSHRSNSSCENDRLGVGPLSFQSTLLNHRSPTDSAA